MEPAAPTPAALENSAQASLQQTKQIKSVPWRLMGPKGAGSSVGDHGPGNLPPTGQGTGATEASSEAWQLANHEVPTLFQDHPHTRHEQSDNQFIKTCSCLDSRLTQDKRTY